jgi:hypothetical protein
MQDLNIAKMREAGRIAREERQLLGLPVFKNPIEKAKEEPASLRKAITAKCYECVGMDGDTNFRATIRTCTSYDCPLYAVRPYSAKLVFQE